MMRNPESPPEAYDLILTYHKINNSENFQTHLDYLTTRNLKVLITVDDGDRSFYETAFPLLSDYKIPGILFVITSLIDTHRPFWWDEVHYHLPHNEASKIVREMKEISNQARLKWLEEIRSNSEKPEYSIQQLTKEELKEMHEAGVIIANHSHTHPMFDKLSENEIRKELSDARGFFEQLGLGYYHWFAYPNGNYSSLCERILMEEGIEKAFLFDHRLNLKQYPLRISRLSVDDTTPLWKFRLIISGWHSRILPVTKKVYKLFR